MYPATELLPYPHALHEVRAVPFQYPNEGAEMLLPTLTGSALDVPPGQVRHPVLVAIVFAGQAVQLVEPAYGATHPGGQVVQEVAPTVAEYVPTGHNGQTSAPLTLLNDPGGQFAQPMAPYGETPGNTSEVGN